MKGTCYYMTIKDGLNAQQRYYQRNKDKLLLASRLSNAKWLAKHLDRPQFKEFVQYLLLVNTKAKGFNPKDKEVFKSLHELITSHTHKCTNK